MTRYFALILILTVTACVGSMSNVQLKKFDQDGFTVSYPVGTSKADIDQVVMHSCKSGKPELVTTSKDTDHSRLTGDWIQADYRCK